MLIYRNVSPCWHSCEEGEADTPYSGRLTLAVGEFENPSSTPAPTADVDIAIIDADEVKRDSAGEMNLIGCKVNWDNCEWVISDAALCYSVVHYKGCKYTNCIEIWIDRPNPRWKNEPAPI